MCLWLCGSVTTIIACVDLHQTVSVGEGSDHLQLIKNVGRPAPPGRGSAAGRKIFGSALLQPARSVCVSLVAFLTE